MSAPVAATVMTGLDAIVGDVSVATVIYDPEAEAHFVLESDSRIPSAVEAGSFGVWVLTKNKAAKIAFFRQTNDLDKAMITWDWGDGSIDPDKLVDAARLGILSRAARLISVTGFCPKSVKELDDKKGRIIEYARALVQSKFGGIIHKVICGHSTRRPYFPREVTSVSVKLSDGAGLVSAFVLYAAEQIATAIRTVRIMDLNELYPSLRLMKNYGYPGQGLANELHDAVAAIDMESRGFRGEITRRWLRDTPSQSRPATLLRQPRRTGVRSSGTDLQGRKIMTFDRAQAMKMVEDLSKLPVDKLTQWEAEFADSVGRQLQNNDLTGRQMFVLHKVHGKYH